MPEPFVGDIMIFAGNFAPRGWALCDGQLLAVSSNDALFSLLGTIYGGDGRTTFGLPDLRGRVPIHAGSGPGLASRRLGSRGGSEQETITLAQLPNHTHRLTATSAAATSSTPGDAVMLATATGAQVYEPIPRLEALNNDSISKVGGSQRHDNMAPYACVNFIIALYGVYPSRT